MENEKEIIVIKDDNLSFDKQSILKKELHEEFKKSNSKKKKSLFNNNNHVEHKPLNLLSIIVYGYFIFTAILYLLSYLGLDILVI